MNSIERGLDTWSQASSGNPVCLACDFDRFPGIQDQRLLTDDVIIAEQNVTLPSKARSAKVVGKQADIHQA